MENIFEQINIETYFENDFEKREVNKTFNFDIFDTLNKFKY